MSLGRQEVDEIATRGTTIVHIRTKELVIVASDSLCVNRNWRIVRRALKIEQICHPTTYATCVGSTEAANTLFDYLREQDMVKKNQSSAGPTLKDFADYGRCCLRTLVPNNGIYTVVGTENGEPNAYRFRKKNKNHRVLGKWWADGSGEAHAKKVLSAEYRRDMSEPEGLELAEISLLDSALGCPSTGGDIRVSVFGSNGFIRDYVKDTLELYIRNYTRYDEFHPRTIYIFSRNQIGDDVVTQWFRSGCCIDAVDVMVSHAIGMIGTYVVRRVVFKNKNASIVIGHITSQCKRYGCRERSDEFEEEISTYACLQIVNERFHFAALTEEDLRVNLELDSTDDD